MSDKAVQAPAAFVPQYAVAYGGRGSIATAVDVDHPLPIDPRPGAARSTPVAGVANASAMVGPFIPDLGRPIWLTLAGTWTGRVTVLRSTDGGTAVTPLTLAGAPWGVFDGNANEPVGEESVEGATWHLQITLDAGSLSYEVRQ